MSVLHFHMGKHRIEILTDRRYSSNHMWCRPVKGNAVGAVGQEQSGMVQEGETEWSGAAECLWRVGFSPFAERLIRDVFFIDWTVSEGAVVERGREVGTVESAKAVSGFAAPMHGTIVRFNQALLDDPSLINVDPYGLGWLYEMVGSGEGLMSAAEYVDYLSRAWLDAQRRLKGQVDS